MPTSPVADLIQRSADANAALMRGDIDRYRALVPITSDFTLMSPFGGAPTHGADMTGDAGRRSAGSSETARSSRRWSKPTPRPTWSCLRSSNGPASKSAACRPRTGRCASPWSIAAKGPNGGWRIGMPTLSSRASAWSRRRCLRGSRAAGTSELGNPDAHRMVAGECRSDSAADGSSSAFDLRLMTALPAVDMGRTRLGMMAAPARYKDPLLERQNSLQRHAAATQNHSY